MNRKKSGNYSVVSFVLIYTFFIYIYSSFIPLAHAKIDPISSLTARVTKPNVLFILDTSGSMQWDIYGRYLTTPDSQGRVYAAHEDSRMYIAKETISDIVNGSRDFANFGLMTFKQTHFKFNGVDKGYFPYFKKNDSGALGMTFVEYEAEDASLTGDASIQKTKGGYSGEGYVHYITDNYDEVTWTVRADSTGDYNLNFRYHLLGTDATDCRSLRLIVNEAIEAASMEFCPTEISSGMSRARGEGSKRGRRDEGILSPWSMLSISVPLNAGTNSVILCTDNANCNGINLDKLIVSSGTYIGKYEAEDASLYRAYTQSRIDGYSGTGYVYYRNSSTSNYIKWTVTVEAKGTYALAFRHASGTGMHMALKVNDVSVGTYGLRPTGGNRVWKAYITAYVSLIKGTNTIKLSPANDPQAYPKYIDCLMLLAEDDPVYYFKEYHGKSFEADGTEDEDQRASRPVEQGDCFQYFGGHDGIDFKYDPRQYRTWEDKNTIVGILTTNDSDRGGALVTSFNFSDDESERYKKADEVMRHMAPQDEGGLIAIGATPTGSTLRNSNPDADFYDDAYSYFTNEVLPYDPISCRKNFIVFVTDGEPTPYTEKTKAIYAAQDLYQDCNVVVYMVGFGSNTAGSETLNAIAMAGGSPQRDSGDYAYYSANREELIDALEEIILQVAAGTYTTSSPSIATNSALPFVTNNIGLIALAEFPKWYGHLRAYNFESESTMWDAGELLDSNHVAWNARKIYTSDATGDLVPFITSSGAVNSTALFNVGLGSSPTEAGTIIRFIAGENRFWRLGDITNCTPLVVGPPYEEEDPNIGAARQFFEDLYRNRKPVVYTGSNDCMLHCFDLETGYELFAYVPPDLLPTIELLYSYGGQDRSPHNHIYGVSASPKVHDVLIGSTWKTVLVCGEGSGGNNYFALDITHPSSGDPGYDPNQPFSMLWHTSNANLASTYDGIIGSSWSTPCFGRIMLSGVKKSVLFVGSGYDDPDTSDEEGRTFMTIKFDSGVENGALIFSEEFSPPASPLVEYGLIADVASYVKDGMTQGVYIADTGGRIWYLDVTGEELEIGNNPLYDAGSNQPFYYSPAVTKVGSIDQGCTWLVAVSGSSNEPELTDPNSPFLTKIHILQLDPDNNVDSKLIPVTEIPINETLGNFPENSYISTSPLIIENTKTYCYEAAFLIYVPPNEAQCKYGTSYVVVYRLGTIGECGEFNSFEHIITIEAGIGQVTGISVAGSTSVNIGTSGLGGAESALKAIPEQVSLIASGNVRRIYWKELLY
ncbi:MAG: PilC/PilY family type IV pilus protein [bacterium]